MLHRRSRRLHDHYALALDNARLLRHGLLHNRLTLDHGLLLRALGVARDGAALDGEVMIEEGETRWTFTPRTRWQAGDYQLVALSILEDRAGNRIGRAFEVDDFERVDTSAEPERHVVMFRVARR